MLTVVLTAISVQAANPEINVAGVEVKPSNYSHISGGDIKSGYGVYDESTNTLTLYDIQITRTGGSNYGIHNRKCSNLTVIFRGSANIKTEGPAFKLERGTTINMYSGSNASVTSTKNYAMDLAAYSYYIKGAGQLSLRTSSNSDKESIHGQGTSSTTVYFQGAKVEAYSARSNALSNFKANFEKGSDLTITCNDNYASVYNVSMSFYTSGGTAPAVVAPFNADYSNNTISYIYSSNTPVKDQDIYISDQYVTILKPSYFPDVTFRNWIYGQNGHKSYLTSSDIAKITSLNMSKTSYPTMGDIANLTGINYLTELTSLNVQGHKKLTSININSLAKLKTLNVNECELTSLNVSNNTQLEYLYANANKITTMSSLGLNTRLIEVDLSGSLNAFGTLSINSLNYLKSLKLRYTPLTSVTVTSCPQLTSVDLYFACSASSLAEVNIYNNSNLTNLEVHNAHIKTLNCRNNKLTSLRMPWDKDIEAIYCQNNQLTSLTINWLEKLKTIWCNDNNLTSLTIDNTDGLQELDCSHNQLTALPSLPNSIQTLKANYNKFTSVNINSRSALTRLELIGNTSLTTVNCYSNSLTTLYLAGCTALTDLNCQINKLTTQEFTLGNCKALKNLNCQGNMLTSINLTDMTALKTLDCSNNKLTSLTIPNALEMLTCRNNRFGSLTINNKMSLKTLDVANNTSLTYLNARDNALASVNVTGCSALSLLYLQHNNLTSLDLTGCNKLHDLYITRNQIKGDKMTALINSLRSIPESETTGMFGVLAENGDTPEYNEITDDQVTAARAKRWNPQKGVINNGSTTWVDIEVGQGGMLGDVDGNGMIDVDDVNAAINLILNYFTYKDLYKYPANADMDGNTMIDVDDVKLMINIIITQ